MNARSESTQKVVVTSGPAAPTDNAVIATPPGKQDIQVVVMGWLRQALIRTLRTYLQAFVGFIVAGGTGAASAVGIDIPARDFLQLCVSAGSIALAPAVIAFIQNAIELLTALDNPTTRA